MIQTIPRVESADDGGVLPAAVLGQAEQGTSAASPTQFRSGSPSAKSPTPGFMTGVVRPDEQYRDEIVRSIFGEVGTPVEGDVLCVMSWCVGGLGGFWRVD